MYRGPLKDFGKEKTSPEKSPPPKKRRVEDQPNDAIDDKLNEIRQNLEQNNPNASTPSKKNKKKNKNKNKTPQQTPVQTKQPEFDYTNVDFNKFGGGSIVEKKNEIKMKFHGKVSFASCLI